jgi:hypothetical protein
VDEYAHPAAAPLVSELRDLFHNAKIREVGIPILFVCGGPVGAGETSLRSRFLQWVRTEFPDAVALLAEAAFRDTFLHDPPKIVNLSRFERVIGDVADCVVVFPETPGSIAELGLFSHMDRIRRKTLVVDDLDHHASGSFIVLGPIRTIDEKSYLTPSVPVDPARPDFTHVAERLGRVIWRKRATATRFGYMPFAKLGRLRRLQVVLEIVRLLQVASLDGLRHCVKSAFGAASYDGLKEILSILVSMGYVVRAGGCFRYVRGKESLLETRGFPAERFTARVAYYYMRHQPEIYRALAGPGDDT